MVKNLKVVSLFSGCGGLDLGLEGGFFVHKNSIRNKGWIDIQHGNFVRLKKTGLKTIFACDIKRSAKNSWENFFKRRKAFFLESIVDLVKKARKGQFHFPKADIVTGGFPCQDFSVAGKRLGFNSSISHHNIRRLDISSEESRGMLYYWMKEVISIVNPKIFIAENVKGLVTMKDTKEIIVNDFRNINNDYLVIDPEILHAGNYGVPQSRERVFFIGIKKSLLNSKIERQILSKEFKIYPEPTHDVLLNDIVTSHDYLKNLQEPENSKDQSQQKYSRAKWYGNHCQGQAEINLKGLAPTIRSEHHGNIEFRRLSIENGGKNIEEKNMSQRRLTVRECARIQTFPDSYQFVLHNVSASEAYKLVGNAIPPLLGYHIAQKIIELLDVIEHNNFEKTTNFSDKLKVTNCLNTNINNDFVIS